MVGILACFAEWQVNSIRDNTRSAMRVKKGRLEKTGGLIPYGFKCIVDKGERKVKKLIPDEDEQKVVELIRDLHRGGKSPLKVSQILNDNRIRPRKAHLWAPQTIAKILDRRSSLGAPVSRVDASPSLNEDSYLGEKSIQSGLP
jgi:DNA invertase Pin-like site-specific DNA recombinase